MWLYNIPEWKLDVIPNGIHPERYYMDIDPDEVKREYGMDLKTLWCSTWVDLSARKARICSLIRYPAY